MFQPFEVTVTFCLGKGEENAAKSGIDNFGGEHGDEGAKTMKM